MVAEMVKKHPSVAALRLHIHVCWLQETLYVHETVKGPSLRPCSANCLALVCAHLSQSNPHFSEITHMGMGMSYGM